MAKRFSDSNKWSKPFLRGLKAPYKLLWLFILDECDHAGIWQVDIEIAQIKIGEKLKKSTAIEVFKDKIIEIDGGEKWFIIDFIDFQYGALNIENRVHESVIKNLKKFNLINSDYTIIKPLTSPLQGAMDKEKDKDMDKSKEKDKEKDGQKVEIILPYQSDAFKEKWKLWNDYRKEKGFPYKSATSEQMALKKLSEFDESFAIELIETSISREWQGLIFSKTKQEFKERNNGTSKNHFKSKQQDASNHNREQLDRILNGTLGGKLAS